MRRRIARPYGHSTSVTRLVSMLMALAVLWALFQRMKDPATWQMLADDREKAAVVPLAADDRSNEQVVPGPNDLDDDEFAAAEAQFALVTDRKPLKPREMDAYWRLLQWGRTEPFSQLSERAKKDVPFTQLWEQPEKYRGKPLRLRLHVQRVIEYDATENPYGIEKAYEAWGWTDESRPFWYCVVLPERPEGLPIGTNVRAELEFVGYFLKVMSYTAADNQRGAPLLMGRARVVFMPSAVATTSADIVKVVLVIVGGIVLVGFAVWMCGGMRPRAKSKLTMLPNELSSLNITEKPDGGESFDITLNG
jgi:hypothetical protein